MSKSKIDNFIFLNLILFLISIFASLIIKLIFNVDFYTITTNISLPYWTDYILSPLMFGINMFFINSIVNNIYGKKSIIYTIVLMPFIVLIMIFTPQEYKIIGSSLMPLILPLLWFTNKEIKFKNKFLRCVEINFILAVYTYISNIIKASLFDIDFANYDTITGLIYSIDLYCLYVIIYLINKNAKEEMNYVGNTVCLVFRRRRNLCKGFQETFQKEKISEKQSKLFCLFVIIVQILQMATVLVVAFINDAIIEFIYLYISFVIGRIVFGKSYHLNGIILCTFFTDVIFYFLTSGVFPISISIYSSVFLGTSLAFVLNYIAESKDNKNKIYSMSEDELKEYCKSFGLDDVDTDIVICRIIYKLKGQDLYDKVCYSKSQVLRREKRIKELLKIKFK